MAERVTLWRVKRSKDGAWSNWHGTPPPDDDAVEKVGWDYETRDFISSTDHESELRGFESRIEEEIEWHRTEAAKARGYFESDPPEPYRSKAQVTASRHDLAADRLSSLLRDRVGQGEDGLSEGTTQINQSAAHAGSSTGSNRAAPLAESDPQTSEDTERCTCLSRPGDWGTAPGTPRLELDPDCPVHSGSVQQEGAE